MSRWLLVGGVLVLVLGCKAKSYAPANQDGDDGGDDGGACTCQVPSSTTAVSIPCGGTACVDETSYLCTASGTALPSGAGACGAGSDAGFHEEGECVPACTGTTCGVPDSCGGTCQCATGVPCNPNGTCGNGCDLSVGDICLTDAGSATTCCSSGYTCFARDSGASACCASNGGGHCSQDTDCCDYPTATCSTVTGTCSL